MSTRHRTLIAALTCAIALSVSLAGCSTAPTPAPSSSAGSTQAQQAKYAACMRAKGYDVPDPDPDAEQQQVQLDPGADPRRFLSDGDACAEQSGLELGSAEPLSGDQERAVAECVRGRGFADYPDDVEGQSKYTTADIEGLDAAYNECFQAAVQESR